MRRELMIWLVAASLVFALTGVSYGLVVDFAGGTATLSDASTVTTNDTDPYLGNVDFYEETGFKADFIGGYGIIGNYYGPSFGHPEVQNSVLHGHWGPVGSGLLQSVVFTKVDGSSFDLNYLDITSNTTLGGGAATGTELTYITTNGGYSLLLPSSDWGIDFLSDGVTAGDGIVRMWLDNNFDGITSFTLTSQNAYCIGLDNFYIDEAPPPIPEPSTILLLGFGLAGVGVVLRKRFKN
jgi:PEP-CTERM motif